MADATQTAPAAPLTGDPMAAVQNLMRQDQDVSSQIFKAQTDPANLAPIKAAQQNEGSAIQAVREAMKSAETAHYASLPPAPDLKMKQISTGRVFGALIAGLIVGKAAKVGGWDTAAISLGKTMENWRTGQMDAAKANLDQYKLAVDNIKYSNEQLRQRIDDIKDTAKTNLLLAGEEVKLATAQYMQTLQPLIDKETNIVKQIEIMETGYKMLDSHAKQLDEHGKNLAETAEKWASTGIKKEQLSRLKQGLPMNPGSGKQAAARTMLVQGSSRNALNILDQIEKDHGPAPKASLYFGGHADDLLGRAAQEFGRSTMGDKQKNIDADYAALIDEAIPALTGGLRGSDAYRRFLVEQMPKQGDSDASAKEKLRVFRQNIQGMQNTYSQAFQSDLPKFAADPNEAAKAAVGADEVDIDALVQKYTGGE